MLDAIDHIALIVKDSGRTATLFKDVFGAAFEDSSNGYAGMYAPECSRQGMSGIR